MRRPWGLRKRVLAAAGAIALVSAVTFGVMLNALVNQNNVASSARSTTEALFAGARLQRLALDLETGVRGFMLTKDETFLVPYNDAVRQLPAAERALVRVPNDPAQRARIATLVRDLDAYSQTYLPIVIANARSGRGSLASAQDGKRRFDEIRSTFTQIDGAERAEQLQRRAESADLRERAIATATVGLAVLLGLIILISYGAVRAVVLPVGRLQSFARELGARRYGARLPESGPPETAELAQAFNATAVSLEAAEAELRQIGERHLAELDAVFREAPLGLAFVDRELHYLRVNEELARINGLPAADHLGREVQNPQARAALREVLEHDAPVLDRELNVNGRVYLASYFPVRGDDLVGAAVIDITDRRRAEAARERLQAATAALAAAATVPEVARATVVEARAALETEGAALLLLDGEQLVLAESRGLSDEAVKRLTLLPLTAPRPIAQAVREGRAVEVRDGAEMATRFPVLADKVPALVALPLIASGATIGGLVIDFKHERTLDGDERGLLDALASQSAVALARAQLYEREHSVAQTLQASLLPRALPEIPGLELAALLEAGATGIEVGGDFYDAFGIGDGAWGIAIGDVCGKGVDAAALTALARHTVRAAAQERSSPADVLRALNRAVLAESRTGQFLTAIFARVSAREAGGFELVAACGGHPPPVLLAADGSPRPVDCSGMLLGVLDDPALRDASVDLDPGDTLLLYTDGVTEAGAPDRTLTTEDVAALLASARGETASETAARCLEKALAIGGGEVRDDVAVLVVQVSTAGRNGPGESSTRGQ